MGLKMLNLLVECSIYRLFSFRCCIEVIKVMQIYKLQCL